MIYNEDCLKTLNKIKDNSIDCVITSPPYNMNLRIRNGKYCSRQIIKEFSTKYSNFNDNLPIDEYNKFHSKVLKELLRVSKVVFYNIQIVTGSKRSIFKMIGDFNEQLKDCFEKYDNKILSSETDELYAGGFWDLSEDMYVENPTAMEQDSIYY